MAPEVLPGHPGTDSRVGRSPSHHDGAMSSPVEAFEGGPPRPITVVIVDDHPVVRRGLRALIDSFDDFEVVGEAGDGEEAVREVLLLRPDVVVMDVMMPGVDGVEATRR